MKKFLVGLTVVALVVVSYNLFAIFDAVSEKICNPVFMIEGMVVIGGLYMMFVASKREEDAFRRRVTFGVGVFLLCGATSVIGMACYRERPFSAISSAVLTAVQNYHWEPVVWFFVIIGGTVFVRWVVSEQLSMETVVERAMKVVVSFAFIFLIHVLLFTTVHPDRSYLSVQSIPAYEFFVSVSVVLGMVLYNTGVRNNWWALCVHARA